MSDYWIKMLIISNSAWNSRKILEPSRQVKASVMSSTCSFFHSQSTKLSGSFPFPSAPKEPSCEIIHSKSVEFFSCLLSLWRPTKTSNAKQHKSAWWPGKPAFHLLLHRQPTSAPQPPQVQQPSVTQTDRERWPHVVLHQPRCFQPDQRVSLIQPDTLRQQTEDDKSTDRNRPLKEQQNPIALEHHANDTNIVGSDSKKIHINCDLCLKGKSLWIKVSGRFM